MASGHHRRLACNSLFKLCASAAILRKPFTNNMIEILQRIKWIQVHAFGKAKSAKNKLRIRMPNIWTGAVWLA
jgi:hypothetical protein